MVPNYMHTLVPQLLIHTPPKALTHTCHPPFQVGNWCQTHTHCARVMHPESSKSIPRFVVTATPESAALCVPVPLVSVLYQARVASKVCN